MMTMAELLVPIAAARTDEVVVTTMSTVRPWGKLSTSDLDLASADSAMGHAADLALGIALARPERRVICLNGDGSMLMTLGTLATIAGSGASNLFLVVVRNNEYEITGNQAVPAAGLIDFAGLAGAAGIERAYDFHESSTWRDAVPEFLQCAELVFASVAVAPGNEGPPDRSATEPSRYLQVSLAESADQLRRALESQRRLTRS